MKGDKIFCLFSVDNNYDQPSNNLVAWWHEKPSLEILAAALGLKFPCERDEDIIKVVNIWSMKDEGTFIGTSYRLEEITPGKVK